MVQFNMPKRNSNAAFAPLRGNHVCVRVPDYAASKRWFVEKLDFRVLIEWPFAGMKLAYLAPADDDNAIVEIIGDGDLDSNPRLTPNGLGDSLRYLGYHHYCFNVPSVDETVSELRRRGVAIVAEPFVLEDISRKLAFFADPYGNLFELAEIVD